ncbi:MAG: DNA polymerase/3'-5' exonuclease PolX [Chloroflexi bacterium]|nr:DNA polymerase/3'-5' exonuclease PolX [Chloroflexota bacterium]MQC27315.1 DNA polymerase/3'-5' exonuclease PolX [Chloroflexota bacterium]
MTNKELADVFTLVGDLLEIKGEVVYKTLAYRKAAESLTNLGRDVKYVWEEGKLTDIPGVGKAIAEKIDELLRTGKLEYLEKLQKDVPAELAELLSIPDLGPKKVGLFYKELGLKSIAALKQAAEEGKLRDLPGMGPKSEAKILDGIESLSRRSGRTPLGDAWPFAQGLLAKLRKVQGVVAAEAAGSLRRMRPTVGDVDILVAAKEPDKVSKAFVEDEGVARVLGHGAIKSSVEYHNGMRAQLWVHAPERFGTALQYATGSKDHNVRTRELAISMGLSLSDQAIFRTDDSEILCATEEEVYKTIGLPWIPPELREDRGEVQAAKEGKLPNLIETKNIRAELHCHTTWSDGKLSILEMAEAAKLRGYKTLAITDHSYSLGIANGLSVERLQEQRKEIEAARKKLGDSLLLLHGTEMEIRADGSLDFPDEILAWLDIVIASLHTGIRQPREKSTQRMLSAINNPHVDIIAHPTNRLLPDREGADLDMDAIFSAAADMGTALEINANPKRLDLDDVYARRAIELGIPLVINTDAHHPDHMDFIDFGVATARRGWVEAKNVINTNTPKQINSWLSGRG